MTASLVFNQLLGGDLDDVKTRILLPLVGLLSEDQRHIEFRTIFLDRLHKKCPYTVPYYPKRQPTMSDKEYLKYVEDLFLYRQYLSFAEVWVMWRRKKVIKFVGKPKMNILIV